MFRLLCSSLRLQIACLMLTLQYSAFQHLAKIATFAIFSLKNEAMASLHGRSVLFALLHRSFGLQIACLTKTLDIAQKFSTSLTAQLLRLAMSYLHGLSLLLRRSLRLQIACLTLTLDIAHSSTSPKAPLLR